MPCLYLLSPLKKFTGFGFGCAPQCGVRKVLTFLQPERKELHNPRQFPKSAVHTQEEKNGIALGKVCERKTWSKGLFPAFVTRFTMFDSASCPTLHGLLGSHIKHMD